MPDWVVWDKSGAVDLNDLHAWAAVYAGKETDRAGTVAGADATRVQLDAGASSEIDHYVGMFLAIVGGTGAGQPAQPISAYGGGVDKWATPAAPFSPMPVAGSLFRVFLAEKEYIEDLAAAALPSSCVLAIEAVADSDGNTRGRTGIDTGSVLPPYGLTAVIGPGAGGVWTGTPKTVGYRVGLTNAAGETIASRERTILIPSATAEVVLAWANSARGAVGANARIYRTDTPGTYASPSLRAQVALATGYTDNGAALSAGAPAAANTTAGPAPTYGVPPTLTSADKALGAIASGEWIAYWVNRVPPVGSVPGRRRMRIRIRP